jgi:hypothetical protein
MAGRTREARELLDSIDQSKFPALYRAEVHHFLGERDAALTALEQGLAERSDWMYSLEHQPFLKELHGEPRFQAVLAQLGLPSR